MGLATIINMIVLVCVPAWGPWAVTFVWVLWWIDVVLAVATNFYLPFIIMSKHEVSAAPTSLSAPLAWMLKGLN
jgi:tellurite resistance protein TehA-like permease